MESENLIGKEIKEIKEAYITPEAYPVLWIGEDGYNITRFAKLIKIKPAWYEGMEEQFLILNVLKIVEGDPIPFKPLFQYITAGGVNIKVVYVDRIVVVKRDEEIPKDILSSNQAKVELARGVKNDTHAIVYREGLFPFVPLRLEDSKSIIAKDYPDTFKIFKQGDKMYIRRLLEDC